MRNLSTVYVCTYRSEVQHGETVGGYTNLRQIDLNVQTDYSQLDIEEFGQTVNEIIKLRSDNIPDIAKGDYLYFKEPAIKGTFTVGDTTYNDYGQGEYQVIGVNPALKNVQAVRNPTLIEARLVSQGS
ncbi:MAG TPA: hypothetical protein VHP31_12275 [Caproicibacter sp.]|nr:hypothetical protein [Caproicibacter sp.]